ncbi:hypothetical protein LNV39_29130, partial [Klebsiella pneumoniae]|nr:hypothetical protein [Klebsiella pneumoniae]
TSAPTVTVAGSLSSDGAYAALWFQDRNSSNRWAWYAGGGTARLWNGSANVVDVTTHRLSAYSARIGAWATGSPYVGLFAGDMVEGSEYMILAATAGSTDVNTYVSCRSTGSVKVRPGGNNGSYETSFETVGAFFRTPLYQLNAASSAFVRQPRIFVQSADPGTAASDGDVWVWTGFVRYRSAGAWVTAAT